MKKAYPGLSTIDLAEEVFCELLSLDATSKIVTSQDATMKAIRETMFDDYGIFGKFLSKINDIFTRFFGTKVNLNMTDSLSTIITKLSDDILFGKESMLNRFNDTTKNLVKKSRSTADLTIKEAKDVLLSRGYIRWFCI
jgi:hypothetical protein